MVWIGKDLKDHLFPLPALGRDATYWISLLRALSHLPWFPFWAQNHLLPTILISKWPSSNGYWLSKLFIFINQAEAAALNIAPIAQPQLCFRLKLISQCQATVTKAEIRFAILGRDIS